MRVLFYTKSKHMIEELHQNFFPRPPNFICLEIHMPQTRSIETTIWVWENYLSLSYVNKTPYDYLFNNVH